MVLRGGGGVFNFHKTVAEIQGQRAGVVNGMDLKSIGPFPREVKSRRCRTILQLSGMTFICCLAGPAMSFLT